MAVNRIHPRHISSALMVCQSIGFTHRRIHRASPLVSGHPVSSIRSTRSVSLCIMHVHVRGIETTHIFRFVGMSVNRIHSPSNPSCLAPCLWSPGLAHSLNPYSLSVHYAHVRLIETTHIVRFDGMQAIRIHSPSNPSCLTPCLWSPGLAHSLHPYSLSVRDACALGSGTHGDGPVARFAVTTNTD